jgi:hypothetical protein
MIEVQQRKALILQDVWLGGYFPFVRVLSRWLRYLEVFRDPPEHDGLRRHIMLRRICPFADVAFGWWKEAHRSKGTEMPVFPGQDDPAAPAVMAIPGNGEFIRARDYSAQMRTSPCPPHMAHG